LHVVREITRMTLESSAKGLLYCIKVNTFIIPITPLIFSTFFKKYLGAIYRRPARLVLIPVLDVMDQNHTDQMTVPVGGIQVRTKRTISTEKLI